MKMPLIAMTICAGLVMTVAPATGETTIDVPIKIKNCASCLVHATSTALKNGVYVDQVVRLRNGAGVLQVPSGVSNFQVDVRKKRYLGRNNSAALIVMAYTGETVGSRISNKRSRTSMSGFVCVPLSEGLVIRARVKVMKTPRKERVNIGGWVQKKYIRAWATPTLPAVVDVYDTGPNTTKDGAASAQQTICGEW